MTFYARRGSRPLNKEEFLAHIALAIKLENVGVLTGAGASVGAGGETMAALWARFVDQHGETEEWLREKNFLGGVGPNIEKIIDALEIAETDARRRQDSEEANKISSHLFNLKKCVIQAAMLNNDLWDGGANRQETLKDHIKLIQRLICNRQTGQAAPWVFTTNYDLSIEWAAEETGVNVINGFSGLHDRQFRPNSFDLGFQNVAGKGEARFGAYNIYLAKLHGSLSWNEINNEITESPASEQKRKIEEYIANLGAFGDGPVLIFPGSAKFMQTLGFVYSEMIRRFTEFLSRPNTCLFISGYGFNDDHLNRVIFSALQNPTLQIVIYIPELHQFEIIPGLPNQSGETKTPSKHLKKLVELELPQVTLCGCDDQAFFGSFASHLPEPALTDDFAVGAEQLQRLFRTFGNVVDGTAGQDSGFDANATPDGAGQTTAEVE